MGFGLCAAFVLGIAAGYVWRGDSGRTGQSPVPTLRASPVATADRCHCDLPEWSVTGGATQWAPGIEDAASLFTASLAQPDGDAKLASLKRAFAQWLLAEPVEAMSAADRIPIDLREVVIAPALAQLAERQPTQALGVLENVRDSYAPYAAAILSSIARTDPRRALDLAAKNVDRDPGGEMMRAIVSVSGRSHLEMVAPAVVAMGERAPLSLIQQVAAEYAARDPEQAYAWARSFAQSRPAAAVDQIEDRVSNALAAHSPDEAAAYLNEAADPRIRASLTREIANRKSEGDLREAWRWLSQYSGEDSYRESARNLLYRWAYLRPDVVASLLHDVADADIRNAVAQELSLQWQRRDSDAYQAWLGALPPGPLKTAMVSGGQ
jgi:hypothetical protein